MGGYVHSTPSISRLTTLPHCFLSELVDGGAVLAECWSGQWLCATNRKTFLRTGTLRNLGIAQLLMKHGEGVSSNTALAAASVQRSSYRHIDPWVAGYGEWETFMFM